MWSQNYTHYKTSSCEFYFLKIVWDTTSISYSLTSALNGLNPQKGHLPEKEAHHDSELTPALCGANPH